MCASSLTSDRGRADILFTMQNSSPTDQPFILRPALLLGMGAGLYSPSGIATLSGSVGRRHRGKAVAIRDLGPNLAFIVVSAAATLFIGGAGWRALLTTIGALCLLIAGAFALFSRQGRFAGQPPHLGNIRAILSQRVFWVVTLYFAIGVTGALGVFAVLGTIALLSMLFLPLLTLPSMSEESN